MRLFFHDASRALWREGWGPLTLSPVVPVPLKHSGAACRGGTREPLFVQGALVGAAAVELSFVCVTSPGGWGGILPAGGHKRPAAARYAAKPPGPVLCLELLREKWGHCGSHILGPVG